MLATGADQLILCWLISKFVLPAAEQLKCFNTSMTYVFLLSITHDSLIKDPEHIFHPLPP